MTVSAMTLSALPAARTPTIPVPAVPARPAAGGPVHPVASPDSLGPLGPLVAVGDCVAVAAGPAGDIVVTDAAEPIGAGRAVGRHGSRVTALAAGGGLVFSAGADGRVLGHTFGAASALSVVVGCHRAGVTAVVAAKGRLVTAGHDGHVLGWGDGTSALLASHRGGIEALALLPAGGVVTAGRDGRLLVHDPAAADRPVELHSRRRLVTLAVTALAGGGVVAASGQRGAVQWWDLHDEGRPDEVGVHGTWVLALVTPDAGTVAAVGGDHVTFWDLRSGDAVRSALGDGVHATSATVLPGGRLAVACVDGRVRVVHRP